MTECHVHERALRIAYKECRSDVGSLLEQTNLLSIHLRSLQLLMTEIFKTKFELNPPFMKDIFMERCIRGHSKSRYALKRGGGDILKSVRKHTGGGGLFKERMYSHIVFKR